MMATLSITSPNDLLLSILTQFVAAAGNTMRLLSSSFVNLESLSVASVGHVSGAGWAHLVRLPRLREVNIGVTLKDAGMEGLCMLRQLRRLSLGNCSDVTSAALAQLSNLSSELRFIFWSFDAAAPLTTSHK